MRKMQFLKPLSSLVLTTLVVFASAQKPGPTVSSESGALLAGAPQLITPAYMRMHHPEFLADLARRVSIGTAPKSSLINVAGANFTESLLSSNLRALPAPAKRGVIVSKVPELRAIYNFLGMPVAEQPGDYSPHSIEYDTMIPNEKETRSVNIMSRIDGTVAASITKFPGNFKILLMQSYNGLAPNQDGPLPVDLTSTNGTLAVTGGQNLSVVVQVGSATSGTFTADLHLVCNGNSVNAGQFWTLDIPLKIIVNDSFNYRAEYEGYNPQLLAFPGHNFSYQVKVTPINYKGPFNATLTTNAYGGLTAQPTTIHFGSNASVTATINCMCAAGSEIQDNVIMGTIIKSDNNESTLFWTQVDVVPFQMKVDYGTYSSNYNVSGYQSFGSVGSYQMTWSNATVLFDGTGNYQLLGTVTGTGGNGAESEPASAYTSLGWQPDFGVYMADYQGHFHGSYNQVSGNTHFIVSMWDDFVKGRIKSGIWFQPAHDTKYYNGNLPPIDKNGNFTAFEGVNIPIQHW